MCCEGCLKQERQGLISLNSKLSYKEDDSSLDLTESPLYWVDNTTDCCQWKGVECNSTTGRIANLEVLAKVASTVTSLNLADSGITPKSIHNISKLKSLEILDLAGNSLSNNIFSSLNGLPHLKFLDLSATNLKGSLDITGFRGLSNLEYLALNYNSNLENEVFKSIEDLSSLKVLSVFKCEINGTLPNGGWSKLKKLEELDLSQNNFVGQLPSSFFNMTSLGKLSLTNNHFIGNISPNLASFTSLEYLNFEGNQFEFPISFTPFSNHSNLKFIYGNGNKVIPPDSHSSLKTWVPKFQLQVLQLSSTSLDNSITLPNFLLYQYNLTYVDFTGDIPRQLCDLTDLNILDLSYNNFVGEIPSCLGEMPFKNKDPGVSRWNFNEYIYSKGYTYNRYGKEKANFTSKKRSETYTTNVLIFMSGIDLSHNQLNGSIPSELGNLTRIRALNLSNNIFMGKIPATFSNLVQVESLDLSFNMLSGQIPPQISGLTFIEVFSVAHNNLSGATPERKGQFITFDESSYEGNQFLCGLPLPKSCNAPTLPNGLNGDDDIWVDMYVFRVSFLVAYIAILLVIAAVLYINPYWRRAYGFTT
ncbi:receptor protein [Trifolium repens]|nr:receptor protein [Trifolium repens]